MSTESERHELWPEPITVIGGTGEYESGKTVFGLSIDPGPRTLVFDVEKSCTAYHNVIKSEKGEKFERIDVLDEMRKLFPNGYKPVDLFLWWREQMRKIEPGKYTVIVVDPVTDIERGLTDWVNANPGFFGHTAAQYLKMSGIMWGDLKDLWKSILGDVATRCQTFYYTAHLGAEFEDSKATGKKKVKGKSTLSELASLFLWFERKPDANGIKSDKPAAFVRKNRLIVGKWVDGELEMHRVLPARMPVATPKAIRDYFANPAGGRAGTEEEKAQDESLTADERLVIEMRTAEAKAAVALAAGGTVAVQAGTPTSPANQSSGPVAEPAEKAEKAQPDDPHKRLMNMIRDALEDHNKDMLKAAGAAIQADLSKLNAQQKQQITKFFAEAREEINKSNAQPTAPGDQQSSGSVHTAAN